MKQDEKMIASKIKAEAQRLGFFACGIAKAAPVEENVAEAYRKWLENGEEASMAYMTNYLEKRLNPALLVPGVRSIVSLAMNYAPAQQLPEGEYQLAAYALGQDYHDLMKQRLRELAVNIGAPMELFQKGKKPQSADEKEETGWGIFCDTAPVLERYWAQKAGLGWVGRNHQLIIPHAGSMFFLGEVFLPFAVDVYDTPMQSRCGSCHRCIDACPTHAIIPDEDFHADRCLSYQLIENRGELSDEAKAAMGNTIYGCDRCQTACPWNRFATPNMEPALQPKPELLSMSKEAWHNLSVEDYRRLFKGSAVKRVKFDGLKRNIDATNN
ncbi:tRNA epoxyqueuosine(34) reductase QueG [Prevotella histicola]|uniref:tRNA epoxyqueuosine(34) reductase QueG n=1 Tax=Prevotella histicola TaxID=470565 RepID=UPI00356B761B